MEKWLGVFAVLAVVACGNKDAPSGGAESAPASPSNKTAMLEATVLVTARKVEALTKVGDIRGPRGIHLRLRAVRGVQSHGVPTSSPLVTLVDAKGKGYEGHTKATTRYEPADWVVDYARLNEKLAGAEKRKSIRCSEVLTGDATGMTLHVKGIDLYEKSWQYVVALPL